MEKSLNAGRLTKSNINNRGYNKYLKMEGDIKIEINYDKFYEDVSNKTFELLEIYKDSNRFILNAGCAIPAETPSDNLKAMIKVARDF